MSFRKSSQKQQPNDTQSRNSVFDNTSSSKPSPQTKKKSAWLEAPLPQFYDHELANEMVRQGCYPSLDEAYLEVPESRLKNVREKIDEYLLSLRPPQFWREVPLPSPKK
jgi:hypothetical protein